MTGLFVRLLRGKVNGYEVKVQAPNQDQIMKWKVIGTDDTREHLREGGRRGEGGKRGGKEEVREEEREERGDRVVNVCTYLDIRDM